MNNKVNGATSSYKMAFPNAPFFERKDYIQRVGTQDSGRLYESALTALIALRAAIDENILDMWVASNGEKLGAFDDLILYTEHKVFGKKIYVAQLKHKKNYKIVKSSFTNAKESFYLEKYRKDYNKIKNELAEEDEYLTEFFDRLQIGDIKFILYTNAGFKKETTEFPVDEETVLKKIDHQDIFNTGAGGGCVYELLNVESDCDSFRSNFYFYTNQARAESLEDLIYCEIRSKFKDVESNISQSIITYFDSWASGEMNGHFKLTKRDLISKLFELLVTPYMVEPCITQEINNTELWDGILREADAVIVEENTPLVVNYVYQALKNAIVKFVSPKLSVSLKSWDVPFTDEEMELLSASGIRNCFVDLFGIHTKMTLKLLCLTLWKIGALPLIIDITNKNLNRLLKNFPLTKNCTLKLIVLGNHFDKFKYLKEHRIFKCMSDIPTDLADDVTSNIDVSLQGRADLPIKELVDDGVLKILDSSSLLNMLSNKLQVGSKIDDKTEFYVDRYVPKIMVGLEVLRKTEKQLFLITGEHSSLKVHKSFKDFRIVLETIETAGSSTEENVVVLEINLPAHDFESLVSDNKFKSVHHMHYYETFGKGLEWKRTWGSYAEIKDFVIEAPEDNFDLQVKDTDVLSYSENKLNIISANPGAGKTTFIKRVANKSATKNWILPIHLNQVTKTISQTDILLDPIDTFYQALEVQRNQLVDGVFNFLKSQKRVTILLDGFDEISPTYTEKVIKIIENFVSNGFATWVTTRPLMKNYLESTFNTLSRTLKSFSNENIHDYLANYMELNANNEADANFIENIKNILTGSPLHINMLAQFYQTKSQATVNWRNFDMTDLFEDFINKKLDVYWKKLNCDETTSIFIDEITESNQKTVKLHEKFALTLLFDRKLLEGVIQMKKIDKYLKDMLRGKKNVGLVIGVTEDLQPIFEHRTYAEYLAAKWLVRHVSKEEIKPLLVQLHQPHLILTKQMFDRILAKPSQIHSEIINNNLEAVTKLCSDSCSLRRRDEGGRTALHLAASYAIRHYFATMGSPFNQKYVRDKNHYTNNKDLNAEDIFSLLLNQGFDPKDLDSLMKWNTFDYAVNNNCLASVEKLYGAGYKSERKIDDLIPLESVVLLSCRNNYINIMKTLSYCPMVQLYENEKNLLHVLSENGNAQLLKYIFHKFPIAKDYVNEEDIYGHTALHDAAKVGCTRSIDVLISNGADVNAETLTGDTSLMIASLTGKANSVMHLITKKADVYIFNDMSRSALHHACQEGHIYCVQLLVRHGLDANGEDKDGWTPLQLAAEKGHAKIVRYLLEKKAAEINKANKLGFTALHQASQFGHDECITVLLKNNADTEARNLSEMTPLHSASYMGQLEVVKILGRYISKTHVQGYTPLHSASQMGHVESMKYLIDLGIDINSRSQAGFTPLLIAVECGQIDAARFLLENGCDLNARSNLGFSALHQAVLSKVDIMELLLENGADVNAKCASGFSPLHSAAQLGSLEKLRFLIKRGSQVNVTSNDGVTPLHKAAAGGWCECVRFLIGEHADINARSSDGFTSLLYAVQNNSYDVCQVLIDNNADVTAASTSGTTVLHLASVIDVKLLRLLLRSNRVDVNAQQENGTTALQMASDGGHFDIVDVLIQHQAVIDLTNATGRSALHHASYEGHVDCVNLLLYKNADVNLADNGGWTPLLLAVIKNQYDVAQLLIHNNANVNAREEVTGFSSLHFACKNGHNKCVDLLIDNNAHINATAKGGCTPMDLAMLFKNIEMCLRLKSRGALCSKSIYNSSINDVLTHVWRLTSLITTSSKPLPTTKEDSILKQNGWTRLHLATEQGSLQEVATILEESSDLVDVVDLHGRTPLHLACQSGFTKCVEQLINNGANVNAKSLMGATPLHVAVTCGHLDIVKILLDREANVNETDQDKSTPLHWAAYNGFHDCVEMLVKSGSDVNVVTEKGWTPLHTAAASGHSNLVSQLIDLGARADIEDEEGFTALDFLPD